MDDIETIGDDPQHERSQSICARHQRACRMILFGEFNGDLVVASAERNRRQSSRIYGFEPTRLARADVNLRADGGYFTATN